MATKTDLQGFLDEFEDQLYAWVAGEKEEPDPDDPEKTRKGPPEGPCRLKCWQRSEGESGRQEMADMPLTILNLDATNVRDELERQIVKKMGSNPRGLFRVRAWEDGKGAKPGVDVTRQVVPIDEEQILASPKLLSRMMYRHLALAERAFDLLQKDNAVLGSTVSQLGTSVSTLATQRATGSAAADLGSPWSIVGLGLLLLLYPLIKRLMAENPEMFVTLQAQLVEAWKDVTKRRSHPRIDPPAGAAETLIADVEANGIDGVNGEGSSGDNGNSAELSPLALALRDPAKVDLLEQLAKAQGLDLMSVLSVPTPDPVG